MPLNKRNLNMHTFTHELSLLLEIVFQVSDCFHLIRHDILHVLNIYQIATMLLGFGSWKPEIITRTQIREAWRQFYYVNPLWDQKRVQRIFVLKVIRLSVLVYKAMILFFWECFFFVFLLLVYLIVCFFRLATLIEHQLIIVNSSPFIFGSSLLEL